MFLGKFLQVKIHLYKFLVQRKPLSMACQKQNCWQTEKGDTLKMTNSMTVTIAFKFWKHHSKVFNGRASNPLEPLKLDGIMNAIGSFIRSAVNETTYNSSFNAYEESKTASATGPLHPFPILGSFVHIPIRGPGLTLLQFYHNQVPQEDIIYWNIVSPLPLSLFPSLPSFCSSFPCFPFLN